jgi:hypothetical protein
VDIYRLTQLGEHLSHNPRAPDTAKWRVIFFLSKNGATDKEKLLSYVPMATPYTLMELRRKGVITGGQGVSV